jgi:hypothetical protein
MLRSCRLSQWVGMEPGGPEVIKRNHPDAALRLAGVEGAWEATLFERLLDQFTPLRRAEASAILTGRDSP